MKEKIKINGVEYYAIEYKPSKVMCGRCNKKVSALTVELGHSPLFLCKKCVKAYSEEPKRFGIKIKRNFQWRKH